MTARSVPSKNPVSMPKVRQWNTLRDRVENFPNQHFPVHLFTFFEENERIFLHIGDRDSNVKFHRIGGTRNFFKFFGKSWNLRAYTL